jgi:hypothetical protein
MQNKNNLRNTYINKINSLISNQDEGSKKFDEKNNRKVVIKIEQPP